MDEKIVKRVDEHLREALKRGVITEDSWFLIAPYGSMNYGLYDENSDVDTKILLVPDMHDIVTNIGSKKCLSRVLDFENEKIEVKDVREFFRILKTGSINFMEILFSDYVKVNPKYLGEWYLLKSKREEIAYSNITNTLSSTLGMIHSKMCLLKKNKNLKDFVTILRLKFFTENFLQKVPYKECITVEDLSKIKTFWLNLKHKKVSEKDFNLIVLEAEKAVKETEILIFNHKEENTENLILEKFLYEIVRSLILQRI